MSHQQRDVDVNSLIRSHRSLIVEARVVPINHIIM